MIKRILVRTLLLVALLTMSLLLIISAVVATEPGTRWLLARVSTATDVQLDYVGGALLRGVTLRNVYYQSESVVFKSERLQLAWRPVAFVWGVVYVDRLALDGVTVRLANERSAIASEFKGWPDVDLPFRVTLKEIVISGLNVQQEDVAELSIDTVEATANYGVGDARVERLVIMSAGDRLQFSGKAGLNYPYALNAKMDVQLAQRTGSATPSVFSTFLPAALVAEPWNTGLSVRGDLENIEFSLNSSQPVEANIKGELVTGLTLAQANFEPNVKASARFLEQPLPEGLVGGDTSPLKALGGTIEFNGWLTGYDIGVKAQAKLEQLDDLALSLTATGNAQRLSSAQLEMAMDNTRLGATGKVSWFDGLRWSVEANGAGINPSFFFKNWPGKIQIQLDSDGSWVDERLVVSAEIVELQGRLRSFLVQGDGGIHYDDGSWQLNQVSASLGANQVELNGSWGESVDMAGVVKAPLLAQIDPGISGQLQASGTLQGTRQALRFSGNALAESLRWQDYSVAQLDLQSSMGRVAGRELAVTATASGIDLNGKIIETLSVSGGGKLDDHLFAFELSSQDVSLRAEIKGGWNVDAWQGSIQKLSLNSPYTHRLELEAPASVYLSSSKAHVEKACLHMPHNDKNTAEARVLAHGCADGAWSVDAGLQSQFSIDKVVLSLFDPWLKNNMTLGGYIQANGELQWGGNEVNKLSASMHAVNAELVHHLSETDFDHYPLGTISASLEGDDEAVRVVSDIVIGEFGQATADVSYRVDSEQVMGQVNANINNLKPLMAVLPGVSDLKGEFILDTKISGAMVAPKLALNMELIEASMSVPPLGIEVASLNAKANGDHSEMTLEAQATLAQGSLKLQLSAQDLLTEGWGVTADLSGNDAQIVKLPQLSLWLNPKISVAASDEKIEVRGSANLPRGRALISTLPASAVKVSNDVVVIDEQVTQPDRIPLHMDLALTLGDDVEVEAAGFKSSLGGKMSLNKTPTRELYAIGDIVVKDGKYEAYGQQLAVERGVISFQGPLDNPGLNITATRRVEDVVVGLIVTGTLQYPETEIYSRPPQSESNAMSMLFTGKKLEYASSGEASMLINAVAKLGVKRGQFLADDIAKKFGLDELTIKSEDDVDASQLWLGKYLTKDIYIHYAVGLFDSISTVGLTYFISDNLKIEAESGVVQSADIIYSMER